MFKKGHSKWLDEEENTLKNNIHKLHSSEILNLLPNRTKAAINIKASVLGLTKAGLRWSESEDSIIKTNIHNVTHKEMAQLLSNRTLDAIIKRASRLGLTNKRSTAKELLKYMRVSDEMEQIRERKAIIEEAELSQRLRQSRIDEMRKYLHSTDTPLAKFDGALFRRLVEKVIIHSLVEATFVFRSGIELREILG